MFLQKERKQLYQSDNQLLPFLLLYPDPGSNRDGLPHWCLRPARLPIPPSGLGYCFEQRVQRYGENLNMANFWLTKCLYTNQILPFLVF